MTRIETWLLLLGGMAATATLAWHLGARHAVRVHPPIPESRWTMRVDTANGAEAGTLLINRVGLLQWMVLDGAVVCSLDTADPPIGNGKADDSLALRKALEAPSRYGGTVHFPPGIYNGNAPKAP